MSHQMVPLAFSTNRCKCHETVEIGEGGQVVRRRAFPHQRFHRFAKLIYRRHREPATRGSSCCVRSAAKPSATSARDDGGHDGDRHSHGVSAWRKTDSTWPGRSTPSRGQARPRIAFWSCWTRVRSPVSRCRATRQENRKAARCVPSRSRVYDRPSGAPELGTTEHTQARPLAMPGLRSKTVWVT